MEPTVLTPTQSSTWGGGSWVYSGDPLPTRPRTGLLALQGSGFADQQGLGSLFWRGLSLEGICRRKWWWWRGRVIFRCPSFSQGSLRKRGCFCLKGGGHRGSRRGWVACSTAGLIPDALLGVQGAAFVCLPIPGVLDLLSYLPFCPFPTQYPSWYLLGTHLRPMEMFNLSGWQHPLHPKTRKAKAASSLPDPPPSTRQIVWESVTSPHRWGN